MGFVCRTGCGIGLQGGQQKREREKGGNRGAEADGQERDGIGDARQRRDDEPREIENDRSQKRARAETHEPFSICRRGAAMGLPEAEAQSEPKKTEDDKGP